jgi:hypothetical protein
MFSGVRRMRKDAAKKKRINSLNHKSAGGRKSAGSKSAGVLSHAPNTIEHKRDKRLRDIIMPLMIFLLEHIVIYIEWRKDREFYCQRRPGD